MMLEDVRKAVWVLFQSTATEYTGVLGNLRIRAKLLVALLPLLAVVIAAVTYSSMHMATADARYTVLLDKQAKALRRLTNARGLTNRFRLLLYAEVIEHDRGKLRNIDADLDQIAADFHSSVDEAARYSPDSAASIRAIEAQSVLSVSDSQSVRAAVASGDYESALSLMKTTVDPELEQLRLQMTSLIDGLEVSIDRQSDALTVQMHRTVSITWVLVFLGVVASLFFALFVVQR